MNKNEMLFFRSLFAAAAVWNFVGAGFGYFNPEYTFFNFFNKDLSDPLIVSIYKGAWGTTLVYIFGYSIVAYNPLKHTGIVIVGGIGKIGFAINLLRLYYIGLADSIVFIVIIGDVIFSLLFLYYFYRLYKLKIKIL